MDLITTVSYSNDEILKNIIDLYIPGGCIECDPTYSKGVFYRSNTIKQPRYKFDIFPQVEDCYKADCRSLPLKNEEINSILFDPPFLATKGSSLKQHSTSNIIANRFSVFPSETELHKFYVDSLKEFYRVLQNDGILIFKCQDKVSSGKQYMSHVFICNEAEKIGFYPIDLFVLLSKTRIVAAWQRAQKHARKYHCYFWVFKKTKTKIKYTEILT